VANAPVAFAADLNETDVALSAIRHATSNEKGDEFTLNDTNTVQPAGAGGAFLLLLAANKIKISPTTVVTGYDNANAVLFVDVATVPNWPNFQLGGVIVVLAALTGRLHVVTAPTAVDGCSAYVYEVPATTPASLHVVFAPLITGALAPVHTVATDPVDDVLDTE